MIVSGAVVSLKTFSHIAAGGTFCNATAPVVGRHTINIAASGVYASGTFPENAPPLPPPPPRAYPYPVITFRVNLDRTATQGTPSMASEENRQYLLSLERLFIPGIGEVKHGDIITLYGIEADYVRRYYTKIGRLPYDAQNTLEVLSIE